MSFSNIISTDCTFHSLRTPIDVGVFDFRSSNEHTFDLRDTQYGSIIPENAIGLRLLCLTSVGNKGSSRIYTIRISSFNCDLTPTFTHIVGQTYDINYEYSSKSSNSSEHVIPLNSKMRKIFVQCDDIDKYGISKLFLKINGYMVPKIVVDKTKSNP